MAVPMCGARKSVNVTHGGSPPLSRRFVTAQTAVRTLVTLPSHSHGCSQLRTAGAARYSQWRGAPRRAAGMGKLAIVPTLHQSAPPERRLHKGRF